MQLSFFKFLVLLKLFFCYCFYIIHYLSRNNVSLRSILFSHIQFQLLPGSFSLLFLMFYSLNLCCLCLSDMSEWSYLCLKREDRRTNETHMNYKNIYS